MRFPTRLSFAAIVGVLATAAACRASTTTPPPPPAAAPPPHHFAPPLQLPRTPSRVTAPEALMTGLIPNRS